MLCDDCGEEITSGPVHMGYGMVFCRACVDDPKRARRKSLHQALDTAQRALDVFEQSRQQLQARKEHVLERMADLESHREGSDEYQTLAIAYRPRHGGYPTFGPMDWVRDAVRFLLDCGGVVRFDLQHSRDDEKPRLMTHELTVVREVGA